MNRMLKRKKSYLLVRGDILVESLKRTKKQGVVDSIRVDYPVRLVHVQLEDQTSLVLPYKGCVYVVDKFEGNQHVRDAKRNY